MIYQLENKAFKKTAYNKTLIKEIVWSEVKNVENDRQPVTYGLAGYVTSKEKGGSGKYII